MPFIKKDYAHHSQPPGDAHASFVGRQGELLFFVQNILKPEDPTHNILAISGQGGVGKSTLLARFLDEAHSADFKDSCLTAIVDERQTTPASIMSAFADQLQIAGAFEKALRRYKEALRRLRIEQETTQEMLLRKAPDFAGAAAEGIPFVGPLLGEGIKATTGSLLEHYRALQVQKDKERLDDPIEELTHAFLAELNRLTDAQVVLPLSGRRRHRRVLLFFDTFEQVATVVTPWLLDSFLAAPISNQMVLIVAGRDPIDHATPDGPRRWLPYLEGHVIYPLSLECFSENETRTYLTRRGITDAERIGTLWQLSGGLPLYLGLLTSSPPGKIDPTQDVVVNFLRWIPQQESVKRQLALDAAFFSRPFTEDDLEAFSYIRPEKRAELSQWLIALPFVRTSPLDGRHSYHEVVQALFCRHLYQRSPKAYDATRRALATYYQAQVEKIQAERHPSLIAYSPRQGRPISRSDEWVELMLASACQLFFQLEAACHQQAMQCVLQVYEDTDQVGEIRRVLRSLIHAQPHIPLRSDAAHVITLLLRYMETDPPLKDWQPAVEATDALLEALTREASPSPQVVAPLYRKRGYAYKKLGKYQRALADYDRAIELDPTYARAYAGRGNAYRKLGADERALEDYTRALELKPGYLWMYTERSEIYSLRKEYTQALEDVSQAIELEPRYGWAYFLRGFLYLRLQEIALARADFLRNQELNPKMVNACWMVEWTGMGIERPAADMKERLEAIATFDQSHPRTPLCRGVALWLGERFGEALKLFEQAIKLMPEEPDAYFWKGMACASLGQDAVVVESIEKALELALPPVLLRPLHWLEQERPDFYKKYGVVFLTRYGLQ